MTTNQIYSSFDPPYYERVVHGTVSQITKFIDDFRRNSGLGLELKFASQGNGYRFGVFGKQPSDRYSIFVRRYDGNRTYDPLGNLIQFEFIEAADRVKVRAVCYYDDTLVIEYFNALWKEFAEFFPAVQANIAKPEGKRQSTLDMEKKIIAEYEKQLKAKRKEFRDAFHRDDVTKVRVTAEEVYDAIGDKIGVRAPRIRQVLRGYKNKKM